MLALLLFTLAVAAQEQTFTIEGKLEPGRIASVSLYGATTPFSVSTLSDQGGRFRFRRIEAGTYTLAVFVPSLGETRQTIVVGPSTADQRGRVQAPVTLDETKLRGDGGAVVSVRQLSIPSSARSEYSNAQKKLARRDAAGAVAHLEKAVEIAPHYSEAWNYLGTIAYQTQQFERAEQMFRRAIEEDGQSYPPLVNLGGVLLNLNQPEEALHYNLHAVLRQPNDALAHSQLGMTHLALGKLDLAEKSLREAIRLDPAHFSFPQIHLVEVLLRRDQKGEAAGMLEHFLRHHPDHPNAENMRRAIESWRSAK